MKYIITEEQYKRIVYSPNRLWILRRYKMIKKALKVALKYVDPCNFGYFELYENHVYNFMMDDLHQEYYLIDNFDYHNVVEELKDLFYVEVTEEYFERKRAC